MPNWPFFCPYMNMFDDEDDNEDDFRSPDGMPPYGPGQGPMQGPPFGQGHGQGPGFQPPPFGPGGPGGPPPFGPGGQFGPGGGFPPGPPPSMTPQFTHAQGFGGISPKAVDPGAIRRCLHRFVFIRLNNGREFWAWLTFVGRTSVAGYRWNGRRWVYFGIDLRRIDEFFCF